jgi:hypothetical protein
MEVVESQGESLAPVASPLFLGWPFIEQRSLLSKAGEFGQGDRHHSKADAPLEGPVKEPLEQSGEIDLPAGCRDHPRLRAHFAMIAVAKGQEESATHPVLAAECATEPLQTIRQSSLEACIVHFIGGEGDGVAQDRMGDRRKDRCGVDALRPSGELSGIGAEHDFKSLERAVRDVSQRAEVEIVQSLQHRAHAGAMHAGQGSNRQRRHKEAFRSRADIVEFGGGHQGAAVCATSLLLPTPATPSR